MCGICGFTGQNVDRGQVLTDMMNRIIHRGPDGAGQYMDDEIAMGFRRLSIIDLEGGDQPMRTEDGRLVITFNGEIYNYRELREELKGRGHSFRTRSDTEVLLHGYSEYGVKILDRLRGMFAFVIWDTRKKELFGARDMFGIKPFYYAQAEGSFIYGSEIKSILEYPGYEREVNLEALEQYMSFQYSVLPETFFKGIFRLPAGHYMIWKDGKLRTRRYFDPMLTPVKAKDREKEEGRKTVGEKAVGEKAAGEKAAGEKADSHNCIDGSGAGQSAHDRLVDEIDRAVQESVRYHMVSDVEVASLLSSGVDSSYVAATFKGAKTFTVGFDYETYNEIPYAEALSGEVGIRNYSKIISTREYWKEFPKIQYYMDEPLADASAAALYFVDREASRHVKVILSGEGADELFGGYVIYHEPFSLNAYQKIPAGVRRAAAAAVSVLPGHPKGKGFIMRGAKPVEERFIGNANVYTVKLRNRVLRHTTKNFDPKNLTAPYYRRARHLSDTEKMQYIDLNFWLQGDILLKADKMSMAHGLESRVPFLDRGVFTTAKNIPLEEKISRTNTKTAFREAARRYIPEAAAQKKKLGFPVPIRIWLRQDKYYGIVKKAFLSKEAQLFFHTEELMKLLDAHRAGREDYSRQIWTVYTFLVWYRQYFVPGACSVTIEDELAMEHMHEEKNREALEESGAAAPALAR
ncbi:asparagine synthase (glutamine-hydrolysing) [Sarcina sp. DSM 11001]|uniref:asparagine synthase (glutamine-hydrolyzing) n=1 Tax=Sarcina sp. DSM 11001 TaxID=1798184 RepID=UPI00088D3E00|nr:asparagine synthase (glutamine-hydrolyzing) [Sarcina sp. DSM 11001]SDK36203.1 asparagine synthase (glutamine-hydrolysing) [Sarcina sp. DSM 11001]